MKKLLSVLLAFLMLAGFAAPVFAADLTELNGIGSIDIGSLDQVTPNGTVPSKPAKNTINNWKIRVYIEATIGGKLETGSLTPSTSGAKGVAYTIGDVVFDEETQLYTSDITFNFTSGDAFETAASSSIKTNKSYTDTFGTIDENWKYYFNDTRPATQTVKVYYQSKSWKFRSAAGKYTAITNSNTAASYIGVDMRPESEIPSGLTVRYTDGCDGDVFAAETYDNLEKGAATPAFTGSTERTGFKFTGWLPAVAETVTESVTYVAQWEEIPTYKVIFNGNGGKLTTSVTASYTSKSSFEEGESVSLKSAMNGMEFYIALSSDFSTNYRQLGWNTKADGKGTHYDMNATITMPAEDVTLYAEWESYEWIHWTAQLGEGGDHIKYGTNKPVSVQTLKMYCGNTGNLYGVVPKALYSPVVAVPKTGYRFVGWYDGTTLVTDSSLNGSTIANLRKLTFAESGAVLEAHFELVDVTVTYTDGVDGAAFPDESHIGKYSKATPRFEGSTDNYTDWKFIGWSPEFSDVITGVEDITYTAAWDHLTCMEHLEDVRVLVEPSCLEKGKKLCRCSVCGDEYEIEIPALGHEHSGRWIYNRDSHWKKCTRCGEIIDTEGHEFTKWSYEYKSTAKQYRDCKVCEYHQEAVVINVGGSTQIKPSTETNPNTGAEVVPSVIPAIAVLAGAAVILGKRR